MADRSSIPAAPDFQPISVTRETDAIWCRPQAGELTLGFPAPDARAVSIDVRERGGTRIVARKLLALED